MATPSETSETPVLITTPPEEESSSAEAASAGAALEEAASAEVTSAGAALEQAASAEAPPAEPAAPAESQVIPPHVLRQLVLIKTPVDEKVELFRNERILTKLKGDCHVQCKAEKYTATHKAVLGTRVPYFKPFLNFPTSDDDLTIVPLTQVHRDFFDNVILDFIYGEEVYLKISEIQQFTTVCNMLNLNFTVVTQPPPPQPDHPNFQGLYQRLFGSESRTDTHRYTPSGSSEHSSMNIPISASADDFSTQRTIGSTSFPSELAEEIYSDSPPSSSYPYTSIDSASVSAPDATSSSESPRQEE